MRLLLGTGLITAAACVALGCGNTESTVESSTASTPTAATQTGPTTKPKVDATEVNRTGTTIVARNSDFGKMLFGPKRQAVYIFERDPKGVSRCYGECARAWPPVYTSGEPRGIRGVKDSLLGTTRRKGGKTQVTYNGKPLYYYVNEGPGQVLCHNVFLNGGMWWVVGPNGKRRP